MPLVLLLAKVLGVIAVSLVAKVLFAIGLGTVTYYGLDTFFVEIEQIFVNNASVLPIEVFQIIGVFKIDVAFKMVVSAMAVRMTLNGIVSGTLTTWLLAKAAG